MLGIPTHFVILDETLRKLRGDPALNAIYEVMWSNREYAYLGSIGPTIGDFIPSHLPPDCKDTDKPPLTGQCNFYLAIWLIIFDLAAGVPGLLNVIKKFRCYLEKVGAIASAEDKGALKAMRDSGEVDKINQFAQDLKDQITSIEAKIIELAKNIIFSRPVINGDHNPPPNQVVLSSPPASWAVRDFLHWKRPGKFAQALVRQAQARGDNRFLAYAYGYLTSYAGKVCGSPFINSIVGGPYRTQWWRHRWINNYVDAWVYGYYQQKVTWSGDDPDPPYDQWKSLCNARLHEKITLPDAPQVEPFDVMAGLVGQPPQDFPAVLPADFADFWIAAYSDAFGAPPASSPITYEELNGAYLMTLLVLWFQTSAKRLDCSRESPDESLGCNPSPPMNPPDGCGDKPGWVQPVAVPGDPGSGDAPPGPDIQTTTDTAKTVSGIILAILGALGFLAGGYIAGAAAIAGGVGLIIDAVEPDWGQLRCLLYWYGLYLYNGLDDIHQLATLGAFVYPYASELAHGRTKIPFLTLVDEFDSGINVVKSRGYFEKEGFPSKPWDATISTWIRFPNAGQGNDPGVENPTQFDYLWPLVYPSWFVTDSPLAPQIRNGGTWPVPTDFAGRPTQFGSAVRESLELFANLDGDFLDWNLDGDRGIGFFTWQMKAGLYGDPVVIEPES